MRVCVCEPRVWILSLSLSLVHSLSLSFACTRGCVWPDTQWNRQPRTRTEPEMGAGWLFVYAVVASIPTGESFTHILYMSQHIFR